jgi:predicted nucleic acid-binding protein
MQRTPVVLCDTTSLQYLHQLGLLHLLPAIYGQVVVPQSVEMEISAGRARGVQLPDLHLQALPWLSIKVASTTNPRPGLGSGENEVLSLALENPDCLLILDDGAARLAAKSLHLRVTGTLGVLVEAKRRNLIPAVRPLIEALARLGFRLHPRTRDAVIRIVDEGSQE